MYPLVRDLAPEGFPVRPTYVVLDFTSQAFCKWLTQPRCDGDWDNAVEANALIDVHRDDPEFGCRFLADELHRAGLRVGEHRVWRLYS